LTTRTILGKEYRSFSSSLCTFLTVDMLCMENFDSASTWPGNKVREPIAVKVLSSVTYVYSDYVCLALGTQHAMRMLHIVICDLAFHVYFY
jgi:hypothetical protein